MSLGCPTAAAACFFANSLGLFFQPNSPIPAAIAPELTSTTSVPALRMAASSPANRAMRARSRSPPSLVRRLVPTLTTRRLIRSFRCEVSGFFIVHFKIKFQLVDLDGVAGLGALAHELFFDAHLL